MNRDEHDLALAKAIMTNRPGPCPRCGATSDDRHPNGRRYIGHGGFWYTCGKCRLGMNNMEENHPVLPRNPEFGPKLREARHGLLGDERLQNLLDNWNRGDWRQRFLT